jgi:hypothetical protein
MAPCDTIFHQMLIAIAKSFFRQGPASVLLPAESLRRRPLGTAARGCPRAIAYAASTLCPQACNHEKILGGLASGALST